MLSAQHIYDCKYDDPKDNKEAVYTDKAAVLGELLNTGGMHKAEDQIPRTTKTAVR